MEIRRANSIEKTAKEILQWGGVFTPNFDVFNLIRQLNIKCIDAEMPSGVSGASMTEPDGTKVVVVNQGHSYNRRRFTAGHELGHIYLGHDTALNISEGGNGVNATSMVLFRNDRSSEGSDWREIEANHFAASLLMPRELINEHIARIWKEHPFLTEQHVANMARDFGVSEIAMSIRLSKLGFI